MSEIVKIEGKSDSDIPYNIIIEYQAETEFLAVFRITLINVDSGKSEGDRFINFNLHDSSSNLPLKFDPGTYVAGVLYCVGKKLVIEAAECINEGNRNTTDLLECMKSKGKKMSISMVICLIKGFWAD